MRLFTPQRPIARPLGALMALTASFVLAACSMAPKKPEPVAPAATVGNETQILTGSAPRANRTPMDPAFACMSDRLAQQRAKVFSVAVGDVKDYTGKYSQAEGNAITQGGALMIYSALGKLGNAVRLHERFDTRIAELELAYADRRQLGDGQVHNIEAGKPPVPWVPYFGGTILRSDYYIVGGITEVNYNISSGGAEVNISNIGGKRRTYTMNVGVDLRIVDSRSLLVAKTVSLQKQIVGEEVSAGIFRFFGSELLDLNIGAKRQEPLQLAVRTAIEQGVLELVGAITGEDAQPCITGRAPVAVPAPAPAAATAPAAAAPVKPEPAKPEAKPAAAGPMAVKPRDEKPAQTAVVAPVAAAVLAAPSAKPGVTALAPVNAAAAAPAAAVGPINAGTAGATTGALKAQVTFDLNSPNMVGAGNGNMNALVQAAEKSQDVEVEMLVREGENLPPAQRLQLYQARVRMLSDALVARGISGSRLALMWLADPQQPLTHGQSGLQAFARLMIKGKPAAAPDAKDVRAADKRTPN
jgi:curli biogenesis system outer membrane secretion channel CsgG